MNVEEFDEKSGKKFEKNETLLLQKSKKRKEQILIRRMQKHSFSVETLFCRSHHHPPRLNYKTAKTRKLKLKLLYLKL